MKKYILYLPLMFTIGAVLTLNSCKKEPPAATPDDSVSAVDATNVSDGMNATADDASGSAGQVRDLSGKTDGLGLALCGVASIDSSRTDTLILTYDGTIDCSGLTRSGTVTVSLTGATRWKDAGAVLTMTLNNLTITRVLTGAHYTINGTQTLTNETGGLAWRVMAGLAAGPVSHRHQGSMQITFADGQTKTWTIDRTRTFTYVSGTGVKTIAVSSEATGNIDITGTNVNGNTFTNAITTDIIANNNSSCPWKPYQGEDTQAIGTRSVTVTFGVDDQGNPSGNPTTCAWGYKIVYTNNGVIKTRLVQYW